MTSQLNDITTPFIVKAYEVKIVLTEINTGFAIVNLFLHFTKLISVIFWLQLFQGLMLLILLSLSPL